MHIIEIIILLIIIELKNLSLFSFSFRLFNLNNVNSWKPKFIQIDEKFINIKAKVINPKSLLFNCFEQNDRNMKVEKMYKILKTNRSKKVLLTFKNLLKKIILS